MLAPAIAAMRGLHTPQATTTYSASMRPLSVTTALTFGPPGVSMVSTSSTSVLANTCRPVGHGLFAHLGAGGERVDHAHAGGVVAAEQDLLVDERDHLLDLGRGDQAGLDAPGLGRGHAALELLEALRLTSDFDAAAGVVEAGVDVLVLAVQREERHLLVVIRGEDEVGGVAGAATGVGQRALVDLHHVGPAQAGQVTDQTVADDAGADDDDLGR